MPRNLDAAITSIVLGVFAVGLTGTEASAQTRFPSDVDKTCVVDDGEFTSWQASRYLPIPKDMLPIFDPNNGMLYFFPPNGPGFDETENCAFYKWASHMFLWLTSPVGDVFSGSGRERTPKVPEPSTDYAFTSDFFYGLEPTGNAPGDGYLFQYIRQGSSATGQEDGDGAISGVGLKVQKPLDSEFIGQAGSNGVVVTRVTKGISNDYSPVFYTMHTSRAATYFRNMSNTLGLDQGPITVPDDPASTCITIGYGRKAGLGRTGDVSKALFNYFCGSMSAVDVAASAERQSDDFSRGLSSPGIEEISVGIDFLVMNMEIKASWVEASTLVNPERYIRQFGYIPIFEPTSKQGVLRETGELTRVELALVGMHLVGSVNGHPEMIWATVEHVDNAPSHTYQYVKEDQTIGTLTETSDKPNDDWLFSDGTKTDSIPKHATFEYNKKVGAYELTLGDGLADLNINRLVPWGNPPESWPGNGGLTTPELNSMLISLNQSVMPRVAATAATDPRRFYFLSGATWTSNGSIPDSNTTGFIAGSHNLTNTTMETYTQGLGCITCHSVNPGASPLTMSHVFERVDPNPPKP